MAAQGKIDLPYVKKLLPAGQDANDRAVRQTLFEMWKKPKAKTLSLQDVETGLSELLVDYRGDKTGESAVEGIQGQMERSIKRAYKAARGLSESKRKKKRSGGKNMKIDVAEFHAFLVTLQHYIELADMFETMDDSVDDNAKVSFRECNNCMDRLARWGIGQTELEEKFKDVDVWTSKLDFLEFADWCIESRWGTLELELDDSENEEVLKERAGEQLRRDCGVRSKEAELTWREVIDIFYKYDSDENGQITQAELVSVMRNTDPSWSDEHLKSLFHAADTDQDGLVDYEEFCRWLFSDE